jgi:signal transduction histidine kinase
MPDEPTRRDARTAAESTEAALAAATDARNTASLEHENSRLKQAESVRTHQTTMDAHQVAMEADRLGLQRLIDINNALLDASVDGIRFVDMTGRTLLANSVMRDLSSGIFGLPASAGFQDTAEIVERMSNAKPFLASMEAIARDPACATEDSFDLAGLGRAFDRTTGPVRDPAGELVGRIIVVHETTAAREVERLASDARRELDSSRLKSELVATVSHELRTPLTSILGFTELMLEHDVDDETRKRYLRTVHGEARRLTSLIDDFLDFEKIEAGHFALKLDAVELADLIRRQVDLFRLQSPSHRLWFSAPGPALTIFADRDRVSQVLANLLSNAIKYSPAGGEVTIAASSHRGYARVAVRDSGLGIPADQQAHVFTKFFRVDTADTRSIGGTGLGLALCREIVQAQSGRMGFESAEGTGSTFWFELPVAESAVGVRVCARVLAEDTDLRAPPADVRTVGECARAPR